MFLKLLNLIVITLLFNYLSFGNPSRSFKFQNHIRVGHDSNLSNARNNTTDVKIDSLYISDIFNITGKFIPTTSSTFLVFYQPEFTHRFDADDKLLYLQDMYINYIRAITPVSQLQITDRFRISEPDMNEVDGKSYAENNLNVSYQENISRTVGINLLAGYTTRINEDNQNIWNQTRDFERLRLSYLISKKLDRKDTTISGGLNYNDHTILHNGGSITSSTLFGGYDYPVNKRLMTSTQLGYTVATIESSPGSGYQETSDSTSPFFEFGMNYKVSKYTSVNTSYSYSLRYTTLRIYNAELRSDWLFAIRHEFTPKINMAISYSLVDGEYESDFARNINDVNLFPPVRNDQTSILNIRGEYKVNNDHSLECGLQFRERDDLDSNIQQRDKVYIGWKLTI